MPTAILLPVSSRGGRSRRRRMSIVVTTRPRRFIMPATSGGASGTRVRRSTMKTSCTRAIGRPNSCPAISTVTNSVSSLVCISGGLVYFERRILERRDQSLAVELGDEGAEADTAPALDHDGRGVGSERDNRHSAH